MAILDPHHFRVDGTVLATHATALEIVRGTDVLADRRPAMREVAYQHGVVPAWDDYFAAKTLPLLLWVAPNDVDGNVTHPNGQPGHMRENLDALLGIFGKKGSPIVLERDVPDPVTPSAVVTRQANVKVVRSVVVDGTRLRRMLVELLFPYPFWHELPQVSEPAWSGTKIITPGGNAPVADPVFTFTAAGRVTHSQSGDYLEATAGTFPLVVDVGLRRVTQGGSPALNRLLVGSGRWMEWQPAVAANLVASVANCASFTYFDAWQ